MDNVDFVALPKIELHAHLTGSVSRQTLHDIWLTKEATGNTGLEDPLVVMPEGKNDYNLETFFPLFSSYIYNLLSDSASIKRATRAVLESFAADGVVYLELRTTPRKTTLLTPAENIAAVVAAISEFDSRTMHTRLILSVDRRHDLDTALGVVELAKAHEGVVVGVDLCGDPKAKPNGEIKELREAFIEAKRVGLEVTVHFAEANESGSREECDELLSWQPGRLGHVIWEDEEVKREIAKRGLCLELCLSCNVQASMMKCGIECGDHHFGYWRSVEGPKIALSTDDVGVFGSPLSNEYRLAAEHFSLDRAAVCALARQPIDGIFGGDDEKKRLREIMWV